MTEVSYRPLRSSDEPSLLELFSAAFGEPRDRARWHWEFLEGPEKAVVEVADVEGRVVGHYAILPRRFKMDGSEVKVGLVVDVMTHPSFGKRGIFVNSGLASFVLAKDAGIDLLIGFPNEAAIKGHRKVGWTELGEVGILGRPLKASGALGLGPEWMQSLRPLARLTDVLLQCVNKVTILSHATNLEREWIQPSDMGAHEKEVEALVGEANSAYPISNSRHIGWLMWRLSGPLDSARILMLRERETHALLGLSVLNVKDWKGAKVGAVMDLVASGRKPTIARILARETIRRAIAEDCSIIARLESPMLRSIGMKHPYLVRVPRTLRFIVRGVGKDTLPKSATDLSKWHLELIDHDVM